MRVAELTGNHVDDQGMVIQYQPAGIKRVVLVGAAEDQATAVVQELTAGFQRRRGIEQLTELNIRFLHANAPCATGHIGRSLTPIAFCFERHDSQNVVCQIRFHAHACPLNDELGGTSHLVACRISARIT